MQEGSGGRGHPTPRPACRLTPASKGLRVRGPGSPGATPKRGLARIPGTPARSAHETDLKCAVSPY